MTTLLFDYVFFFFFNDTATTEIYTLSLHDALPICSPTEEEPMKYALLIYDTDEAWAGLSDDERDALMSEYVAVRQADGDRKSTRLNSSHANISYAVFCLKKKKKKKKTK